MAMRAAVPAIRSQPGRRMSAPSVLLTPLIALLLGLLTAAEAGGEDAQAGEGGSETPVRLERLLELPSSIDYTVERRGSATRGEWRERFRETRASLDHARTALEKAQRELEGMAEDSEAWQLAPPGATEATNAPLSYRLRQEIRRQRAEVRRAEQRLRELEVEAELAGVPPDWRQ